MSEVLDSLATAIALTIVPWLLIMIPTSAALAYRRGWNWGLGALCGCIPIPFAGWMIVLAASSRTGRRLQRDIVQRVHDEPINRPVGGGWEI